ncbi:iron-sulfur cluster insertion protein ErpA [Zavarzinia sp. CC-PAN008]|uniref:iron-sulfur cluster insertion protein ErpA n=1 Tax=Zavarzinia sp. CC-PAN008 TaxID=3243332 RepID=UPI003F743CE1
MSDADTLDRPATIDLTDSAARRIVELIAEDGGPGLKLRIAVTGGGCSGFSYNFSFDDTTMDDDLVVARNGATVLVDSVSLDLLKGSVVDFVEDMMGASFQVKNPNATSSCGCGSSFAV